MTMKNKKAVSLMVSYVLLIIIAITLALIVFAWLKLQSNIEETPKCPEGVSLIIQSYECLGNDEINITVKNKGLFNISGFIIRGTNNTGESVCDIPLSYEKEIEAGRFDFEVGNFLRPLAPNEVRSQIFSYSQVGDLTDPKLKKIQLQPFRIQEDKRGKERLVLCEEDIITENVNCE